MLRFQLFTDGIGVDELSVFLIDVQKWTNVDQPDVGTAVPFAFVRGRVGTGSVWYGVCKTRSWLKLPGCDLHRRRLEA
ncbi:hypothetical protein Poly59_58170 [Rubripirellula reticaptiva]|uniref:Uncharacterized protein n=1 Tax=Rubripirellula reticaptiva TaxID=2528013 RepID=A0A5C6EEK5_9BACT|nr:hypothetical protein Poly59_58170 [Rubripirellula reticaptiva]